MSQQQKYKQQQTSIFMLQQHIKKMKTLLVSTEARHNKTSMQQTAE